MGSELPLLGLAVQLCFRSVDIYLGLGLGSSPQRGLGTHKQRKEEGTVSHPLIRSWPTPAPLGTCLRSAAAPCAWFSKPLFRRRSRGPRPSWQPPPPLDAVCRAPPLPRRVPAHSRDFSRPLLPSVSCRKTEESSAH